MKWNIPTQKIPEVNDNRIIFSSKKTKIATGQEQTNYLFKKGFETVRVKDKKGNIISIKFKEMEKPKSKKVEK